MGWHPLPPPLCISVRIYGENASSYDTRVSDSIRIAMVLPHGYPQQGCDAPTIWLEPELTADPGGNDSCIADSGAAAAIRRAALSLVKDDDFCSCLQLKATELASAGEECLLPLCQDASELVREHLDEAASVAVAHDIETGTDNDMDDYAASTCDLALDLQHLSRALSGPPRLGRRGMFSHHIIASSKRQAISQWAAQLQLGGLAKIGWPGIIIVEGDERDVQHYVDALSRLRWKHFVVRGEQTVEGRPGQHLDDLRALPLSFQEFGTDGMSDFAARCRQCGLEELFIICLKLQGGGSKADKPKSKCEPSLGTPGKRR